MKVILTEGQMRTLLREESAIQVLTESLNESVSFDDIKNKIKKALALGMSVAAIITAISKMNISNDMKQKLTDAVKQEQVAEPKGEKKKENGKACVFNRETKSWEKNPDAWQTVVADALGTVYNAVPGQCNADVAHTASMFKLNLGDVLSQRVLAVERTFMRELGLKYGDVVYVEGTGTWDGPWQVQDTMNKKFAGMHKIDFLVPNNIKTGKWNGIKISVPTNKEFKAQALSLLAPSL